MSYEIKNGHGYAWLMGNRLCNWAEATKEQLSNDGKPSPEAKAVKVQIVHSNNNLSYYRETNIKLLAQRDELLAICEEIANSQCDLGDSERRIRLYHAIMKAGSKL